MMGPCFVNSNLLGREFTPAAGQNGRSNRKRNSGSYLNDLLVGQGASEASSLTNPFIWHHPQIVR